VLRPSFDKKENPIKIKKPLYIYKNLLSEKNGVLFIESNNRLGNFEGTVS
jgi:hypothetical protein